MSGTGDRPVVFVTVGTDHHPFDRLIDWVDNWAAARDEVRCVVQHGTSRAPNRAEGIPYLSKTEQTALMEAATVVVCHGGPATMADVRRSGHLPVVVPRLGRLGEHVDDHQERFSTHVSATGWGKAVGTEAELRAVLDWALLDPTRLDLVNDGQSGVDATRRLGALADRLLGPTRSTTVLYVSGFGRSGSTLLARLLGQLPGFVSVGELVFLWERGLQGDQRCGCGEHFRDCKFWTEVGFAAFGGWDHLDVDRAVELKQAVDRNRQLGKLVAPWIAPVWQGALREWADGYLAPLYSAVAAVAEAKVVVDSSKHTSYAFLLRHVPSLDLRVAQTVRDPRGVAYSWAKQVQRPELDDGDGWMPQYSAAASTGWWLFANTAVRLLPRLGTPTEVVRYEELVAEPVGTLRRLAGFAGSPLGSDSPGFIDRNTVTLGVDHSVAGNPMRFRQGAVELRADEEWRTGLSKRDGLVVSLLASACPAPSVRYPLWMPTAGVPAARPGGGAVELIDSPARHAQAGVGWPSVSAVIATRDRPELLQRAIQAIVSQDYPGDLEIVVVFDQSDVDHDLANEQVDRPIRVTANRRSPGLAGGRNSGIALATGELIAFCDDDDEWLPGKLRTQVALLEAHPGALVVSCGIEVDYGGTVSHRTPVTAETTFDDLLASRVSWIHPSTVVAKREAVLEQIGLVDEEVPGGYGEDYEWLLRAARQTPIQVVRECLVRVHWHPRSFFADRWEMIVTALTWLLERYPDFERSPAGRARIEGQIAFAQAAMGKRRAAARSAASALGDNWREPRALLSLAVASGLVSHERVLKELHKRGKGI